MADILDYNKSRQADTFSIQKILIYTAWVNTDTLLKQLIIIITFSAFSTDTADRIEASSTVTIAGVWVEYLIDATSITLRLVTVLYFNSWATVDAVLCVGVDC